MAGALLPDLRRVAPAAPRRGLWGLGPVLARQASFLASASKPQNAQGHAVLWRGFWRDFRRSLGLLHPQPPATVEFDMQYVPSRWTCHQDLPPKGLRRYFLDHRSFMTWPSHILRSERGLCHRTCVCQMRRPGWSCMRLCQLPTQRCKPLQ